MENLDLIFGDPAVGQAATLPSPPRQPEPADSRRSPAEVVTKLGEIPSVGGEWVSWTDLRDGRRWTIYQRVDIPVVTDLVALPFDNPEEGRR